MKAKETISPTFEKGKYEMRGLSLLEKGIAFNYRENETNHFDLKVLFFLMVYVVYTLSAFQNH